MVFDLYVVISIVREDKITVSSRDLHSLKIRQRFLPGILSRENHPKVRGTLAVIDKDMHLIPPLRECRCPFCNVHVDPFLNLICQFRDILPRLAVDVHRHTTIVDVGITRHESGYRLPDCLHQSIGADDHLTSSFPSGQEFTSHRTKDGRVI